MNRVSAAFLFLPILSVSCFCDPALAAKAYTTDTQEVQLRSVPKTSEGKTLMMVPPSSAVDVVSSNGWTHVRYTKPDGTVRDGWIQSRFLGARPPDSTIAKVLTAENDALKEQLSTLEQERTGLAMKEKDLTDRLGKISGAYEELKSGSANYVKLKAEYDSAKSSLSSAQENIQSLIQENENLKLSQRLQWFAAGAMVLLFGWFIGWATGKRQKKKRGSYYY